MAGTKIGGKKAAETNRRLHGKDFYKRVGKLGGKTSRGGGFGQGEEGRKRASTYGKIGGKNGTRRGIKNGQGGNPASRVTGIIVPLTQDELEVLLPAKKSFWQRIFG